MVKDSFDRIMKIAVGLTPLGQGSLGRSSRPDLRDWTIAV